MLEPPKESALIVRKMRDVENGIFAAPGYLEDWGRPIPRPTSRIIMSSCPARDRRGR